MKRLFTLMDIEGIWIERGTGEEKEERRQRKEKDTFGWTQICLKHQGSVLACTVLFLLFYLFIFL